MATPSRSSKSGSGGNDRPAKSGLGSFFGGGSKKAGPPPPNKGPPKKAPSPVPMEVDSARATFSFWDGSISGIASRPAPTKPAYIAWYGTLTGDIWHVAAAQILSEYIRTGQAHPFPAHEIRTCLTIMAEERYGKGTKAAAATSSASRAPAATGSRGQSQEPDGEDADEWGYGEEPPTQSTRVSPCVTRGRKSWRYLQAIRLNASLVMVPHREGSSQVGLANSTLSSGEANMWYVDTPTTFDEAVAARLSHIGGRGAWADGPGVDGDPCLIDLLASTTVVMQMMEYIGYAEAQRILGYRLSGGATLSGTPGESLALRKVDQLCGLIESVDTWLGKKGHKLRGVVLFNYRIGDVNRQHNAGAGILHDVRSVAAEHGYATIVIPQMASSEYARRHKAVITLPGSSSSDRRLDPFMNSFVFDLLDVEPPAAQPQQGQGTSQQAAAAASPFMDDTAKAYFWHLVATYMQGTFSPLGHATGPPPPNFPPQLVQKLKLGLPPVVGLVGGRSGSTDLPGFVGLRVWSWEEPLLEALHGAARPTSSGDWSSRYYTIQGPQATRLFNQQPIIATGWLSMDGFQRNGKDRIYTNLNLEDGYLKRWLGGGANGVPPLPVDANTTFLTNFFTTNLNKISNGQQQSQQTSSSRTPATAGSVVKAKSSTSQAVASGPRVRPGASFARWNDAVQRHRPQESSGGRVSTRSSSTTASHPYALSRRPAAGSESGTPFGAAPPAPGPGIGAPRRAAPGTGPSSGSAMPRLPAPGTGRGGGRTPAPGPGQGGSNQTQAPRRGNNGE